MTWFLLALVIFAGAAVIYRLYSTVKKGREVHGTNWDTRLIAELRKRGQDPFESHKVNFFFALPDEAACTAINRQLEADGFQIDIKAMPGSEEFRYSLHATKSMRLHAPEMQELSRRFNALAASNRGRYDGWGSG